MLGLASFSYGLISAIASERATCDPTRRAGLQKDGFIFAADEKTILAVLRGSESRILISSRQIAPTMKHAIVAVEDRRFFEHRGIDVRGIARALWADIRHKRLVEGGSTITQQLVKNTCVDRSRSIARKLKEATLAWQLEQGWSKERILTAYLNTIYFGNGAYGIQRAAKTYFGHGATKLTWAEAALLAGIPADPSRYDPVANPAASRRRRGVVLRNLLEQGYISGPQLRAASREPLPRPDRVRLPVAVGQAQYFTNYVRQQLVDRYGSGRVFGGGLRVVTSIDLGLQRIARESISRWLPDELGPSAALVAIDPRDGRVLAMIGGRSFRESQFNLAVQGERQPGSAFKPFVLAAALQNGLAPETTFESKPVTIPYDDKLWAVRNYENSYLGRIDLATATIASDNAVYAQLTNVVGPRAVSRMARRLGITSPLQDYLAIGLGGEAVNPLEMARAYASFANGGRRVDGSLTGDRPRAVLSINDRPNAPRADDVLPPNGAALVNSILQRVITGGTGTRAQLSDGRPIAGKTGTTENYGDAWFVGYTPQLAVAVWVGYPNLLRPMLTEFEGRPVAGGTFPALIWKTFADRALPYLRAEPEAFPEPTGYDTEPVRLALRRDGWAFDDTGLCRTTIEVQFFSDFEPQRKAHCKPNEVDVPIVVGQPLARAESRIRAQPLIPVLIYRPARPRQRLGVVVGQLPAGGTLSSYDEVKLVLPKATHGVVPRLIGLPLDAARRRVAALRLRLEVLGSEAGASEGAAVLSQAPRGGLAAAPGMLVRVRIAGGGAVAAGGPAPRD